MAKKKRQYATVVEGSLGKFEGDPPKTTFQMNVVNYDVRLGRATTVRLRGIKIEYHNTSWTAEDKIDLYEVTVEGDAYMRTTAIQLVTSIVSGDTRSVRNARRIFT